MSLPWKQGQQCLVVQCDQVTGEPVPDGCLVKATAAQWQHNGDIEVVLDLSSMPEGTWVPARFDASDCWNTHGRERTWRLMTPEDFTEEEPAPGGWRPGDPVPDPPGHGYWENGDY